jgi:sialidase-1
MTRNLNRRQALFGVGAAAGWIICGPIKRADAGEPRAVIHETKIISQQPQYYHGWPTLVRCRNGELILLYSGGREDHVCPFGRLELMRSGDEGKTWGQPTVVFETGIDDREAGLMETASGTLLANTFTSLDFMDLLREAEQIPAGTEGAWAPDRLRRWQAVRDRLTGDQRQAAPGMWMIRSADGGLTWSTPYKSPVSSPHGPTQCSDGRLLHAGKEVVGSGRTGVCESTDDGQTWQWLADIPQRPGDNSLTDYHELHMVEVDEGRLVVQIRNHNTNNFYETLQTESSDGGKSWTLPHSIGVWGLPSHLLRLNDNRLLMTYGYRRAPFGNQARVSDDQGRTWSESLTISDDGVGGDLGYPSTVQLADGSLLSVWYEGGSYQGLTAGPHAVLRQSHWTLVGK